MNCQIKKKERKNESGSSDRTVTSDPLYSLWEMKEKNENLSFIFEVVKIYSNYPKGALTLK